MNNKSVFSRVLIAVSVVVATSFQFALAQAAPETQGLTVTLTQLAGNKKIDHPVSIESSTLSEPEQALLAKLLKQSGVLEIKSMKQMGWVTPSVTQWKLAVAEGPTAQHEITLDENTMSPEYGKLIKFILKRDKKKLVSTK